jgi:hypothetical protein
MIMKMRYKLLLLAAAVPMMLGAQTKKWDAYRAENGISLPTWAVKTNLLADLTASMNLGVELRTGNKTSIELVGQWNPFSFRGGETKWKHWGVQPEFRYWLKESFRGHFLGLQATYAFYNVGGLPNGPFTDYMHNNRFQGDLYGAGVSWGHRWNFSRRWGLEVTAAVGYLHKGYDRWECQSCGKLLDSNTKNYFGPTEIGVNLIFGGGSKVTPVIAPPPPPAPVPVAKVRYEPKFVSNFVVPVAEEIKVRNESGSAFLEFATGRSEIVPTFRSNATELESIHQSIRSVNGDPDSTIKGIYLVGYASPEGTYSSNMTLSDRRARTLKTYLNGIYNFRPDFIQARGEGEDWTTLGRLVEESNIAGKQSLLSIIQGSSDPDSRDRQMMALGGSSFDVIRTEMYPKLRRTDYRIEYEVAPISIERGKQIMRTNPRNLSLNELFLIANTNQPGSAEFREVMNIAARTFPDSDVANVNAATVAIQEGDAVSAAALLGKVKNHDADWNNNMGIVSFMQGDAAAAAGFFRAAGAKGSANAAELEKHLRSIE